MGVPRERLVLTGCGPLTTFSAGFDGEPKAVKASYAGK